MTDQELIATAQRASVAVFVAVEASVAREISALLLDLVAALERALAADRRPPESCDHLDCGYPGCGER